MGKSKTPDVWLDLEEDTQLPSRIPTEFSEVMLSSFGLRRATTVWFNIARRRLRYAENKGMTIDWSWTRVYTDLIYKYNSYQGLSWKLKTPKNEDLDDKFETVAKYVLSMICRMAKTTDPVSVASYNRCLIETLKVPKLLIDDLDGFVLPPMKAEMWAKNLGELEDLPADAKALSKIVPEPKEEENR